MMSDSETTSHHHSEHEKTHDHHAGHPILDSKFKYLIPLVALLGAMVVTGIIVKLRGSGKETLAPQETISTQPTQANTQVPQGTTQTATDDITATVDAVSKLIVLPSGETPKVVTITNVDQLKKDQPFFSDANNGDKLLVYSKKVILFNPRTNRVVDIAQIRFSPDQAK